MMHLYSLFAALALWLCAAVAFPDENPDDPVLEGRIKVWLFAYPAYFKGVLVDAYKDECTSLDNNLIDGQVNSFLVGGPDVETVMSRTDTWYCVFYDTYDCSGEDEDMLISPQGINNLNSVGWASQLHSLMCHVEQLDDDSDGEGDGDYD
ncbi:hypothetical protein EJ04DRAFT_517516 [Polyplosphaeria fusca]|uniref:Uncharacterized protein n=1 Tax=Polyplosphaeria fusca TaxID=682080 RepID=A0A9P4QLE1_9PLEO|nr:hypothetical protein EJ04DRAFT_517516 [Polyplosphaeria fusca]